MYILLSDQTDFSMDDAAERKAAIEAHIALLIAEELVNLAPVAPPFSLPGLLATISSYVKYAYIHLENVHLRFEDFSGLGTGTDHAACVVQLLTLPSRTPQIKNNHSCWASACPAWKPTDPGRVLLQKGTYLLSFGPCLLGRIHRPPSFAGTLGCPSCWIAGMCI